MQNLSTLNVTRDPRVNIPFRAESTLRARIAIKSEQSQTDSLDVLPLNSKAMLRMSVYRVRRSGNSVKREVYVTDGRRSSASKKDAWAGLDKEAADDHIAIHAGPKPPQRAKQKTSDV